VQGELDREHEIGGRIRAHGTDARQRRTADDAVHHVVQPHALEGVLQPQARVVLAQIEPIVVGLNGRTRAIDQVVRG
jgi:hypothetical protein